MYYLRSRRYFFLSTTSLGVRFIVVDSPSQPNSLSQYILKTPCGTIPADVRPWQQKRCINFFNKKKFFKVLDLVHRPTAAPVAAENCR